MPSLPSRLPISRLTPARARRPARPGVRGRRLVSARRSSRSIRRSSSWRKLMRSVGLGGAAPGRRPRRPPRSTSAPRRRVLVRQPRKRIVEVRRPGARARAASAATRRCSSDELARGTRCPSSPLAEAAWPGTRSSGSSAMVPRRPASAAPRSRGARGPVSAGPQPSRRSVGHVEPVRHVAHQFMS